MTAREIWSQEVTQLANERGCNLKDAAHLQRVLSPNLHAAAKAESTPARLANVTTPQDFRNRVERMETKGK